MSFIGEWIELKRDTACKHTLPLELHHINTMLPTCTCQPVRVCITWMTGPFYAKPQAFLQVEVAVGIYIAVHFRFLYIFCIYCKFCLGLSTEWGTCSTVLYQNEINHLQKMVKHTLSMTGYPETPPETPDPVSLSQVFITTIKCGKNQNTYIETNIPNFIIAKCLEIIRHSPGLWLNSRTSWTNYIVPEKSLITGIAINWITLLW